MVHHHHGIIKGNFKRRICDISGPELQTEVTVSDRVFLLAAVCDIRSGQTSAQSYDRHIGSNTALMVRMTPF